MRSRWSHLKSKAVALRRQGISIGKVEDQLGIARSTLSGWFKTVKLTTFQKKRLELNWRRALIKARAEAVKWHNLQKEVRLKKAKIDALETLSKINLDDNNILELALSIIYLGEGFKRGTSTAIGNSDPKILKFFISAMKRCYDYDVNKVRCELHLRADQDPIKMKKYWARQLNIPLGNFKGVVFDKRTKGKKTYSYYKGVCVLQCGRVDIQRKMLYLSSGFCDLVANMRA